LISPPSSRHGFRTPSPHEVLARIIASGLRVVPGTDAGIGSFKPHDVYPHALSQLADLGMPTRDVLRSATSEAVGRGRLRPVADADLLVLGSSPIEGMSAVRTSRRYTGRPTAFADPAAALVVARKEAGTTGTHLLRPVPAVPTTRSRSHAGAHTPPRPSTRAAFSLRIRGRT